MTKIVSGGQTGADRAALDFAIAHQIPHGGWCPQGRVAEDGAIDWRYRLKETPSSAYVQRTEWNVRDSDGTLVFSISKMLAGGSLLTVEFARMHRKPSLHIPQMKPKAAAQKIQEFLNANKIRILNVAGPRESTEPTISEFVRETFEEWWNLQ